MMSLTQESILSFLIAEGGKATKSDLVNKFKGSVDCVDPAEKERNRELFKTFVNSVAVVREIDGVRYVVLKKAYQHLFGGSESHVDKSENEGIPLTGEQRPLEQDKTESSIDKGGKGPGGSAVSEAEENKITEDPAELISPIMQTLRRSKYAGVRVKRMVNFDINKEDPHKDKCPIRGERVLSNEADTLQRKPYALPLRMPPSSTRVEFHKLKEDPDQPPQSPKLDSFRNKRRLPSMEAPASCGSPQLRRAVRSTKVSEEPRDSRIPSLVPLEQAEHQWLVKCAAGHWSQVYGLLLRDNLLADKKDFISGFTALHWAAKRGNTEMLVKIIDISKQGGTNADINVKAHGGYTPLHIAALHNQEYIMTMLVGEYGADVNVRDNCGKKAYHYLHKGISKSVREMLGEHKPQQPQERVLHEREEMDSLSDHSKGFHSISRLFQPTLIGHKKKHKQRPELYSLYDNPVDEQEDGGFRHRLASDVFM
ncbi:ankyrin repeat domain-containing protein SOWAHA-like [Melanotaenia boesemani]|uniref:ankyrin repeat domain-containing protein SOWAHA-like n=1 Tax=Melanotaenia boesemani TaxID=1250792 RepID=UPI001C04FED7|nr:ankyrin repeat domain-containing protein SOWAHA-like [Melanotaenia boesemani]